jgi:NADH dehydrogenase
VRIAITGASGFVGRHVTRAAAAQGIEVVGVVRSEPSARLVAEAGGHPVQAALGADPLTRAFEGAQAVIHLAQIGAERTGATYEGVNVGGTRGVVEAARRAKVRRLVIFSGLGVAHYGMAPRTTNPYFLSKLTAELEVLRSGLEAVVFRPSYVLGPGGELIAELLREIEAGHVETVGDGRYRMQPIFLLDAAALVLAAIAAPAGRPAVFDLVGPEPVSYAAFVERVARVAGGLGRGGAYRVREIPVQQAERQAASGGYRGMLPDALDCLLCDEVSDPRPLEALLGRPLTPLDAALAATIAAVV